MNRERFATAINCIDGRAQLPVLDWLKLHCNVHYTDLITEPGADDVIVRGSQETVAAIRDKVRLSIEYHAATVLAVVAHHDCLAHPVSRERHFEDIKECVRLVSSWRWSARTLGLWVNEWGSVDLVCDTDALNASSGNF